MSAGTDIIEAAAQELSQKNPRDGQAWWRCGRFAFDAICEAAFRLDDTDVQGWPELQERINKANAERRADLEQAKSKWGEEGNMLFGVPILCDEDYNGLRLMDRPLDKLPKDPPPADQGEGER